MTRNDGVESEEQVQVLCNFRNTAEIEVFHNLIFFTVPNILYSLPAYMICNILVAIDNNMHVNRPVPLNNKGETMYYRTFKKKSAYWAAYQAKKEGVYTYIPEIKKSS